MIQTFAGGTGSYYQWVQGQDYRIGDVVFQNYGQYFCGVNHISGSSFGTDFITGNWTPIGFGIGDLKTSAGVRNSAQLGFYLTDGSSHLRVNAPDLFVFLTSTLTCTISIASPCVVTATGHGLSTGSRISFETTGTLPTGLSAGTNYYAIYINANTFNVASSYANALAGTKINTSGTQSGVHTLRNNPWGVADLTHFNVPDTRGVTLEGIGQQNYAAWASADYIAFIGQYIQDVTQGHIHDINHTHGSFNTGGRSAYHKHPITTGIYGSSGSSIITGAAAQTTVDTGNDDTGHYHSITITAYSGDGGAPKTDGSHGTPRTGNITQSASIGMMFMIKY